jgi:glycosyltransferase involved in cell wall biosynthesis
LEKRKDNAFLLLVGVGGLKENIEMKLHNYGLDGKYLILSYRSDIPEIMKAMDVFVFPSLYEGLPVALIETQVSNLRCIVSDNVPKEAFSD